MKTHQIIYKKFIGSASKQINRYYIAKLYSYHQEKVSTISAYFNMNQPNPTLLISLILLTVNCTLIPIAICILLIVIEEIILICIVLTYRHNIEYLSNYKWNKVAQQIHSCLQFIKYNRMIELGYGLRTNTNIMLHDQKQNNPSCLVTFDQKQQKMQMDLIKIYQCLVKLFDFIVKQFKINNKPLKQIKFEQYPLNFKTIFELNHNFGIILNQLQSTNRLFTSFVNNQLNKFSKIVQVAWCIRFYFKIELQKIIQSLKLIQNEIEQKLKATQNSRLYNSLQEQQEHQRLEQILGKFNYVNQFQSKQKVNRVDQVIEINSYPQTEIRKETKQINQNTQQIYQQRKKFMAKLDTLLIMGLARKRQQELEAKLKMQQQHQQQIQVQQKYQ